MREYENINNNFSEKIGSCKDVDFIFEQLKNENTDKSSMEILKKLAFLRLVDASKKYHMEKMQGKDSATLEKTQKLVSQLYFDYKRVKNWTEQDYEVTIKNE